MGVRIARAMIVVSGFFSFEKSGFLLTHGKKPVLADHPGYFPGGHGC